MYLHVVARNEAGEQELELQCAPGAVAGELATALGWEEVSVDGAPLPPELPLARAGLHEAAVLEPGRPGARAAPVLAELAVVGGLDAGRRLLLRHGTVVLGRSSGTLALGSATVS